MWMAIAAFAGATAGFVVMAIVDPAQRSTDLDIWAMSIGALVGAGISHLVTRAN